MHHHAARLFISLGRVLLFLSFLALAAAWITQIRGASLFGMTQEHLFFDAIALGVLGIGCLLDSMLHAKNL